MHIRFFVITFLICILVALSNVTAKSHLEGRVTYSRGVVPNQYIASEKQLQGAYDELSALLGTEGKRKLNIAQTAWKRFKAAECDFDTDHSAANPLHPLSFTECLTAMNVERIADLEYEMQWHQLLDPSFSNTEE